MIKDLIGRHNWKLVSFLLFSPSRESIMLDYMISPFNKSCHFDVPVSLCFPDLSGLRQAGHFSKWKQHAQNVCNLSSTASVFGILRISCSLSEGSLLSVEMGSVVVRNGSILSLSPYLKALDSHALSPEAHILPSLLAHLGEAGGLYLHLPIWPDTPT